MIDDPLQLVESVDEHVPLSRAVQQHVLRMLAFLLIQW
jgi:hypothetical protein